MGGYKLTIHAQSLPGRVDFWARILAIDILFVERAIVLQSVVGYIYIFCYWSW